MDLADISARDLQAVIAVASHGHFGRAAAALRMAQSTLSARVLKVEGALGTDIFERTGRSFLVTAEGDRLLPLLREVLAANDRLASAAAESRGALGGGVHGSRKKQGKTNGVGSAERFVAPPLRVGAIPTLGPYLIPHLLLPLRKELPELTLEFSEQPTARLIEELQEGLIDAALLSFPIRAETLEVLPLFEEPFRLLGAKGCPLLTGPRPTVGMLNASEMLLLEEGHCLRDQALALCRPRGSARRTGASPANSATPDGRAKVLATSLETLKYLVAASASDGTQPGYTLVPLLAAGLPRGLEDLVRVRAFEGEDAKGSSPSRRIGLCIRRTFTRRAEAERLAAFIRGHLPSGVRKLDR